MANPVDAYRGQQGLTADVGGYHPDPQVVSWIKMAAAQTGADPVALMATALQESGGKLHGPAGDKGTSYSAFQFHVGGALGNHPPAWAATYPAFLNRAQQFARLGVRGGRGAAAVQGPADPVLYAQGVDSLLAVAHAILGAPQTGVSTPTGTAGPNRSAIPAVPARTVRAKSQVQAALDILGAKTRDEVDAQFADAGRMISIPGTPARASIPGATASVPGSPIALSPGGGWAGSHALAQTLASIGQKNGLSIASEKRARQLTASGNNSDHWVGSKSAYAYDLSNGAKTPQEDATAMAIATALGAAGQWVRMGRQGILNINKGGYRYQMLWRTGGHFDHVHIGVRKL